jgi:hypothetical protein
VVEVWAAKAIDALSASASELSKGLFDLWALMFSRVAWFVLPMANYSTKPPEKKLSRSGLKNC